MDFEDLNWKHRPYNSFFAYCQSKLANILFTKSLAKRLEGTDVIVNALHPGAVNTEIPRNFRILVSQLIDMFFLLISATSLKYLFPENVDNNILRPH